MLIFQNQVPALQILKVYNQPKFQIQKTKKLINLITKSQNMTKTYHNGPVDDQQRQKTDRICLVIFVLFNLAIFGIAIHAWTSSNFSKLSTPYDPDGKGCGLDYPQYPFIYFASPHPDSLYVTTCVKTCPKQGDLSLQCQPNSVVKSCTSVNNADNTKAIQIYETILVRGVICMPTQQKVESQIYAGLGPQAAQQKMASLSRTWVIVLISIPLSILLAMVFVFLMRITAGFFIYFMLLSSILSLVVLGIYLIVSPTNQYAVMVNNLFHNGHLTTVIGIVVLLLGVAIAIMSFCFRDRIKLASSIVKVSTRFVNENCPVMIMQTSLFVIMTIFLVLWFFQALGFYSMGQPTFQENALPFQHFQSSWKVKALGLVHLFYLFWGMIFFVHTGDFLVSGTVTSWYFLREQPYKQSLNRFIFFHLGSVCMGSFLIALFGFLKFLRQLLTPQQQQGQGCMKTWKKICDCCCYLCVNWLFNCLNSGAYTFIHLSGDPYCASALEVLAIRIKDILITGVVTILSVLFQILIRIGITALTCLIAFVILKNLEPYKTQVHDITLTMIMVGLIGFTISSFFVSLYSQAMQAISVCYLIDKDAGGRDDKCPDELKDFLEQAKLQNHTLMQ